MPLTSRRSKPSASASAPNICGPSRRTAAFDRARRAPHRAAVLRRRADGAVLPGRAGFPLTDIFENRDYKGSNHFFFDIGNGNLLAFFDFPGLDLDPYAEVLGGLHHIAISVEPEKWERLKRRLEAAAMEYLVDSGCRSTSATRRRAPGADLGPAR